MRYTPPIKGRLKKSVMSPIQPMAYAQDIGSISNLLYELRALREDIVAVTNVELDKVDQKIAEIDAKMEEALRLEKGEKGEDADELKIAEWVLSQIPIPKDGRDGKDADEAAIVAKIAKMVPKSDDIAKEVLKRIPENKASLKVIQEKIGIDEETLLAHIDRLMPKLKQKFGIDSMDKMIKILDRRYIHGGGFSNIANAAGIVATGLDTLKFIGSGVSSVTKSGNTVIVDISNASGGFTVLAATGDINDTNTTFTFTSAPTLLNINGAFYSDTSTVGGVLAWTIVGTTVTTAFPVGTGGSIFGIA